MATGSHGVQYYPQPYTPHPKQGPNKLRITLDAALFGPSLGLEGVAGGSIGLYESGSLPREHNTPQLRTAPEVVLGMPMSCNVYSLTKVLGSLAVLWFRLWYGAVHEFSPVLRAVVSANSGCGVRWDPVQSLMMSAHLLGPTRKQSPLEGHKIFPILACGNCWGWGPHLRPDRDLNDCPSEHMTQMVCTYRNL